MKLVKYIKVKVGEYTKDGETKGKYETVGRVLVDDKGKEMILLNRTFNPAGVPSEHDSIILNLWDVEEKREVPASAQEGLNKLYENIDDKEIPF